MYYTLLRLRNPFIIKSNIEFACNKSKTCAFPATALYISCGVFKCGVAELKRRPSERIPLIFTTVLRSVQLIYRKFY